MRFWRLRTHPDAKGLAPDSGATRPGDDLAPSCDGEAAAAPVEVSCLADGVLGYHLFLGRPPESDEVAEAFIGLTLGEMARRFLESDEFTTRVLASVVQTGEPGEWQGRLPAQALQTPLTAALGVDPEAVSAARDWAESLGALLEAPIPRETLLRLHGEAAALLLRRVDAALASLRTRLAGQAEALRRIRTVSKGLEVLAVRDIVADGEGLRSTSGDPWILAVAEPLPDRKPLLRRLTLTLGRGADRAGRAKLYFDLGRGFEEAGVLVGQSGISDPLFILAASDALHHIRIDPLEEEAGFILHELSLASIQDEETIAKLVEERAPARAEGFYRARAAKHLTHGLPAQGHDPVADLALSRRLTSLCGGDAGPGDYSAWLERYERPYAADYLRMAEMMAAFSVKPSFSFVMPMYNTPLDLLSQCLNSLLDQNYTNFNICIADDNSSDRRAPDFVEALAARDPRVRFVRRRTNGHISEASNSALALADGDYIVLVDHDDIVPDYCLFVLAEAINRHPGARILFSDEDKLSEYGERCLPYFKTKLNTFLLYGHNMISHLGVYERALVRAVGGFRKGFEGSQDYDLALRCIEVAGPEAVVHIPHVLYHWRMIAGSTAVSIDEKSYAAGAATAAVEDHFRRAGLPLTSEPGVAPGLNRVGTHAAPESRVSILIPTRDGLDLLRPCIESVRRKSTGRFEVVVVDNGSCRPDTLDYFEELRRDDLAKVVAWPEPFNFSAINNFGVQHCAGEIVCFLNNDTEVVSDGWLDRARTLLSIADVGAVGARLLYPDGALQHMGIALGMGAHGVAGTPHGGLAGESPGYFGKARLLAEFSAATAACLFVRRTDFLAVDGFEPALAVAYNDIDLCLKLRRSGLKVLCDPEITLIHKESRTRGYDDTSERALRLQREADFMLRRWPGELADDPYSSPNLSLMSPNFDLAWPPRTPMPWFDLAHLR